MNKDELSGLLKVISNLLSDISDEEYRRLIKGQGRLSYSSTPKSSKLREESNEDLFDINLIANKLVDFNEREEAMVFLTESNILKNDLIKLTSQLDIFINKNDSKEKIIEKIVEATVGVKMRSKAIQETQLKHSNKLDKGYRKNAEEGER